MEQSPVNAIRSDWGRMCDAGKKMSDLGDEACGRVFISHLYGLLLPDERAELLNEAFRVGCEIVILDPGRPIGANAEEWQSRMLPDGTEHPIFRCHLDIETLIGEVGGEALFDGQYFVMIRRPLEGP
jgi:hypothetical protein